jgi:hypothetical protein
MACNDYSRQYDAKPVVAGPSMPNTRHRVDLGCVTVLQHIATKNEGDDQETPWELSWEWGDGPMLKRVTAARQPAGMCERLSDL